MPRRTYLATATLLSLVGGLQVFLRASVPFRENYQLTARDEARASAELRRRVCEKPILVPPTEKSTVVADIANGSKSDDWLRNSIEWAIETAESAVHLSLPTETPLPDMPRETSPAAEPATGAGTVAEEKSPEKGESPAAGQIWHLNYDEAVADAAAQRKMLFIYFHGPKNDPARKAFETCSLLDKRVRSQLAQYVLAYLPMNAQTVSGGRRVTLLQHSAFTEMQGRQGVAVVDLAHVRTKYYGHVVSTFPFSPGRFLRPETISVILDLPPGTLTQRTMIYAVRTHPERPASTYGQFHHILAEEAQRHSFRQASMLSQGHHSWESRFHQINARIPAGLLAQEVVAESWPNQNLVDACVDCVHSWRQSPGHWGAVRARHLIFGYDIQRGRNGIWYATGIFGRR